MAHVMGYVNSNWNLKRFDAEVRKSTARSIILSVALRQVFYFAWDNQLLLLGSDRHERNYMDLNILKKTKRFQRWE